MKRIILFLLLTALCLQGPSAQEASHLSSLVKDVIALRKTKVSKTALNQTVLRWSEAGKPKITLMDEIGRAADEYRGAGANKFKMNQVVTFVYDRQNRGLVSKGEFFNSTEKGIFYSAIEKTVPRGKTVSYTLTSHLGPQEFAFIPFNPKARYSVAVNDKSSTPDNEGIVLISLGRVALQDSITFSISLAPDNVAEQESFTILNYNPQK